MSSPPGDDITSIQWLFNAGGTIVAAVVAFLIKWNWKIEAKIDDARAEALAIAREGDKELANELKALKDDLIASMREHRQDFKDWQQTQNERWEALAKWRENMVAMTPTRNQLDHKIDEVIERLDARMRPLLPENRRRRRTDTESSREE